MSSKLLDRYIEVLNDEEEDVQSMAIEGLPWVINRVPPDQVKSKIIPCLQKILQTCEGKVKNTVLLQMGRFSEKLHNLNMFTDIEESLLALIKSSFADTGKKPEQDFELAYKGLKKSDSDPDLDIYQEELTEWQINQQDICYNLPAIALFMSEKNFFKVLYPHLCSLSDNKFINIKQIGRAHV